MSNPIPTPSEQRLQEYLPRLTAVLGHADCEQRLPPLGPITAWIIGDTGFPKEGQHSAADRVAGKEPRKYRLSILPETTSPVDLVGTGQAALPDRA